MTSERCNCWEVLGCGREPGGAREEEFGPCPAATDVACDGINGGVNAGRLCWAVPGTLCGDRVQGRFEEKREECRRCRFFRQVMYEEGPRFQLLMPGLEETDPRGLHRQLANMIRLVDVCRDIFACLAVRPLLESIAQHTQTITGACAASVYVPGGGGEDLRLEIHAGGAPRPERVALEEDSAAAEAARTHRLCRRDAAVPGRAESVSIAAIPIGTGDPVPDVLEIVKGDSPLSSDDEWYLREFALLAGLGIENARHVEDLRELKQFNRAKSRFVALLMHHIASPLATIACSLQALSQLGEGLAEEDRDKLIRNSLDRIQSVQALSRRLLDLAAIRGGTALAEVSVVDPAEALQEELQAQRARAQEKGVEVRLSRRGPKAAVAADPAGLRLIFGNLIANAIKYSEGPDRVVTVDLECRGDRVGVCIRDQGIGIPAEEQAGVFEEFHRGSNVGTAHASGFGLGLAVVKELVDRYGGGIELESEVGVGTAVTVDFPAAEEDEGPPAGA